MSQHLHLAKGHLSGTRPRTSNGKKVFFWQFYCVGQDAIPVEVLLQTSATGALVFAAEWDSRHCPATRDEAPAESGITFETRAAGRRVVVITDSDIERLRQRAEALLNEMAMLRLGVQWEPWLEITVGGDDDKTDFRSGTQSLSAGLDVSIVRIERGVSPCGAGRILMRRPDGEVRDFPLPVPYSVPDRSKIRIDHESVGISYIPDTPEHRVMLEDLIARLRGLRQAIGAAAAQEVITTMGAVATKLLPEPPDDGACPSPT